MMDFSRESLFCKAKYITSFLGGIMLWTLRLPFPMCIQEKQDPTRIVDQCLQLGLKTLICSSQDPIDIPLFTLHSHMIHSSLSSISLLPSLTSPPLLSRSSTLNSSDSYSFSILDDMLGTESGVCLSSNEEESVEMNQKKLECNHDDGKQRRRIARKKEYPPPIPSLVRTGSLPGHMPWIFTRENIDGKLVLSIEKVKHHEYFEAYRENGRLVLNLVSLDDTVDPLDGLEGVEEEMAINGYHEEMTTQEIQENQELDDEEYGDRFDGYSDAYSLKRSCGDHLCGTPANCLVHHGSSPLASFNMILQTAAVM